MMLIFSNPISTARHEILTWVNDCLQAEFGKVEELCTGAAQCQIMDMLFPGEASSVSSVPVRSEGKCCNALLELG